MCVVEVDDDELLFDNTYIAVRINTAKVAAYSVTLEAMKWPPTPLLLLRRMETILMVQPSFVTSMLRGLRAGYAGFGFGALFAFCCGVPLSVPAV